MEVMFIHYHSCSHFCYRYYEAVYACGLPEDISALPAGDHTEVSFLYEN